MGTATGSRGSRSASRVDLDLAAAPETSTATERPEVTPVHDPGPARPDPYRALPVTGAWRPGDEVGRRHFVQLAVDRPMVLEGGGILADLEVAYETWGTLDEAQSNAVLVCHALTGDSHAAGRAGHGHPSPGWWDDFIGPGKALDTDRWFVVCTNVLGGCQGTTGPASIDPATGRPFGGNFPIVTIRDMVRVQARLADHLGVGEWLAAVGGSMGGMQVLEWGIMFPDRVRSLVPIATAVAATAQQIAYGAVQRNAIALDPGFRGGDYYDAEPGSGPHRGLAIARSLAQVTYRTDQVFTERFGRDVVDELDYSLWQRFDVEGYLDYHGQKLVKRFDANTYLRLSKAMDLHDIARARGGTERALSRITVPTCTVSISSDALYYPYQQHELTRMLRARGVDAVDATIDSEHGHDAFLLEADQVGGVLRDFLDRMEAR
jgi:homoserine O-acetyltransferase